MKLKDYIQKLQEIDAVHPNLDVIYACDEEGNRFSKIVYEPSHGHFDGYDFGNEEDDDGKRKQVNAVCVN